MIIINRKASNKTIVLASLWCYVCTLESKSSISLWDKCRHSMLTQETYEKHYSKEPLKNKTVYCLKPICTWAIHSMTTIQGCLPQLMKDYSGLPVSFNLGSHHLTTELASIHAKAKNAIR